MSVRLSGPFGIGVTNDGTVYFTTFGGSQVKQLSQLPNGNWQIANFFGKASNAACGISQLRGRSTPGAVDQTLRSSMSLLCNGRPRALAIKDTCPRAGGSTRIAFSQMFDKYVNVIEVVKPCAAAP